MFSTRMSRRLVPWKHKQLVMELFYITTELNVVDYFNSLTRMHTDTMLSTKSGSEILQSVNIVGNLVWNYIRLALITFKVISLSLHNNGYTSFPCYFYEPWHTISKRGISWYLSQNRRVPSNTCFRSGTKQKHVEIKIRCRWYSVPILTWISTFMLEYMTTQCSWGRVLNQHLLASRVLSRYPVSFASMS